jgi:hypothetical protein
MRVDPARGCDAPATFRAMRDVASGRAELPELDMLVENRVMVDQEGDASNSHAIEPGG